MTKYTSIMLRLLIRLILRLLLLLLLLLVMVMMVVMVEGTRSFHGGRRQSVFQLQSIQFLGQRRRRRIFRVGRAGKPVVGGTAAAAAPRRPPGVVASASTRLDLDDGRLGRLGEPDFSL